VTLEFYGLARRRAGRPELTVQAGTVVELLAEARRQLPALAGVVLPDGRLSPHYLLSLNGQRFLDGTEHPLRPGDHVLLLSADAGG
jgi:molybdopterin converting factor small subunit